MKIQGNEQKAEARRAEKVGSCDNGTNQPLAS